MNEPLYLISVVAKMLNIHPQTLRQYEREGLVAPSRTDGKMRLYSSEDVEQIRLILRLTRELGVNLAGVDVILRLKRQISELEAIIDELKIAPKAGEGKNRSLVKMAKCELTVFSE